MNHKINGCIKYQINENTQKQEEVICLYPEQIEQDEYIPINQADIICEFIIKEKLGEGAFGAVHLGINKQTEENVAIKILEKSRINKYKGKVRLEREIEILKKLKHPNIVQFYCVIETQMKIFLIEEYIKGKELFQYIILKKKLSEEEACFYFQQIISGIEYLQKLKIAHRDIKSENILIEQYTNNIKIIDFGLSNSFDDKKNELLSTACGSPCYAAPEMLDGKMYNGSTVDIWSVGVVLFSMICGYLPFHEESNKEMYKKIIAGKYTVPSHVSKFGRELIHSLLNTNPKKRIKIQQIKKHSWIKFYSNGLNNDGKSIFNIGLLIDKYVMPIDEEIVDEMEKLFKISKIKIRTELLYNKSNDYTSLYYLMLNKKIKSGRKSIADLKSELFISYIENKKNLLSNYNNDIENVVKERKMGIIFEEGNLENDKEKSMFDSQVKYNIQSYDNIYKIHPTIKENEIIKGSSYNSIFKGKHNNKNKKLKNNKLNIEIKKRINADKNELQSSTPKSTKNNKDIKLKTIFKNNDNSRTIPQNIETYQKRKFKNLQSYLKTANLSPIIEKKNLTINLKHKKKEKNKKINMTVGYEKYKGKEVKKRNVIKFLKIKTYSHDDLEEEKNTEKKKETIINDTDKNLKIIKNKEAINIINDDNLKEEKNKDENITNVDNNNLNNDINILRETISIENSDKKNNERNILKETITLENSDKKNNEINLQKETITLVNSDKKNNENLMNVAPSLEVDEINNKILDNKTYNHKIIESIFVQTINQEKNEIITSTNSPRDIKSIDLNTLPIKKEVNKDKKYLSSYKTTKKKDKRFKLLKHISKCDSKSDNKVKNYKLKLNKAVKNEIIKNINEYKYYQGSKTQRNWNSKKNTTIQRSFKNKTNLTQNAKPKKDINDKNKLTTRENYLGNIESYNSKRATHKFNSFIERDIINELNFKSKENNNIIKEKITNDYNIKVSKSNTKKVNSIHKDKFSINFNNSKSNTINDNKDINNNKNNVKRFNTCKNNLKNNNFKFKINNKLFISKFNSKKLKDRNIIKNLVQNKSTKNEYKSNFNYNNYLVYNKLLKSEVNNSMNENEIKNNFSVYNERSNKNIINNNNIKNNLNKQEIENIINEQKQELQDLEPFDLSCTFNLSQKIAKEKILNNLEKLKYKVKQINSYKYNISNRENKNKAYSIYELSIPPNYLSIIKFKKIKAMNNNYVTDIRQIINQLN